MSWIESHQKLKEDPKVAAVASVMEWNVYECIGRLHVFWWWCVDHCEDGDLRRYNDVVIASVAGVAAPDAKRFVEAMANGCGTKERPDGFFERVPYFRIANWWKFTRRFMQKRYERTPEVWKAIAHSYGYREGLDGVGSAVDSTEGPKRYQPTNQPTNQQTLEVGGGVLGEGVEGGTSKGVAGAGVTGSGRFALPKVGGLPVPLFPATAGKMKAQCDEEIKRIREAAKKTAKIETVGTERVRTGTVYEPEAQAAIDAWKRRKEEIERGIA